MSGTSRLREQVAYSTSVAPQQMYPAEFVRGRPGRGAPTLRSIPDCEWSTLGARRPFFAGLPRAARLSPNEGYASGSLCQGNRIAGTVSLTCGEQNEPDAGCALTRLRPHLAIGSPPRLL